MKRSLLLLLPALAVFLMACPQKHATSSATPPAPDPNGYVYGPQVTETSTVTITTTETTTVTTNNTGGVITKDSVHVVGKPDTVIVSSKPDSIRTRLVVSFISTGGGIDLAAQTNLDKWLSKRPDVKFSQNQWGREGEVDYCFIALGANADAQKKTVEEIKNLLANNPKVLMKENKVCTHKHEIGVVTMPDVEEAIDAPKSETAGSTRLVVSFLSPGDGIDQTGHANLEKYLAKHPELQYTQSPRGREGEVTYCFQMTGKTKEEQAKIVSEIRGAIGTNSKTFISENQVCTHSHKHVESNVQNNVTEAPDAPKADSSNIARVVVSFISKGQGTDYKTKERLANWLKEQNVEYEEKSWGREGETNVCIFLKGKTNRQQDIFVRDLRTFIGENELVLVEEWGKCDKRK